ncbi:MAG: hypothetical protein QG594_2470 [Bacteroidota bacterium]|jgi:CYTH domain-containing protein|nr:hypothetical protein [Bacteroidota bacterium]
MKIPKIPYDGGSCAGKTTIMANHAERLCDAGFNPLIVPESATILINMGLDRNDPLFQDLLISEGLHHENIAEQYAQIKKLPKPVLLCDRAIPSGKAYMQNPQDFYKLLKKHGFENYGQVLSRYDGLIFMESVAVDKPEAFTVANNSARDEGIPLDELIAKTKIGNERQKSIWVGHKQMAVIDNSTNLDLKKQRSYGRLCNFLGIPEPIEAERKYLIGDFSEKMLAGIHYQVADIQQRYLVTPGCRIRKRSIFGHDSYYHTFKKRLPNGENVELEETLSEREYIGYFDHLSHEHAPIYKKRYCFLWKNQYFELDVFYNDSKVFQIMLEIELTKIQDTVILPPFLPIIKDVTDDPNFRNENIAKRLRRSI